MRRWWVIGGATALCALVLLALQLALPRLVAGTVEGRLTEGGGSAEVTLSAFPALRMLWGSGDRLEIAGRDLTLPLGGGDDGSLKRLGGFGEVDVDLAQVRAGPFELERLTLARPSGDVFRMAIRGSASPAEAAQALDVPGAELGELLLERLPVAAGEVPIDVSVEFTIEGDRIDLRVGSTRVAGLPAGRIVEALTAAVVDRL